MTRIPGRRQLPLLAVVIVLSLGSSRATAGCINSDGLAPFAEAGLLDLRPVAVVGEPTDGFTDSDPTNPDGPTPSGLIGGFFGSPAFPAPVPTRGRQMRSSSTGVDGGVCPAAVSIPDLQLVTSFRAASAATALKGPIDSIFHPPRVCA